MLYVCLSDKVEYGPVSMGTVVKNKKTCKLDDWNSDAACSGALSEL